MPTRSDLLYRNTVRGIPKANKVNEDSHAVNKQDSDEDAPPKPKRYKRVYMMRYNQDNEINRLLVHNAGALYFGISHDVFPSFNACMWPQNLGELIPAYPACAFSVPRPIYISDAVQEKIDLCFKRSMNRQYQRGRMFSTRTAYQSALSKKTVSAAENDDIYHSTVYDMAERILLQHDPYFHGGYDYYYTGGNLSVLPETRNVIHVGGKNLQTINFSELAKNEDGADVTFLRPTANMRSLDNCEIFEVKPMLTSANNHRKNCFIARQRNVISLNYLNDNQELKIITQFRTRSTPFISFCQSERDANRLLLTTMKQEVRLYDLNEGTPKFMKVYRIAPNSHKPSWNTIKPWRENTFLYANEHNFCLMDTRTKPDQWMSSATSVVEYSVVCDHISAIQPSDFNNLFYLATSHKLHCLDVRQLRKSLYEKEAVICRWSHQMHFAPLMMDTYRCGKDEFIALSSPVPGDLHICQLSRQKNLKHLEFQTTKRIPKHIFESPCLPYAPPTLEEAYEYAKLAGKCLQPESNLKSHIRCCTTGLNFSKSLIDFKDSDLGFLLTSNSVGDVFAHNLTRRESQQSDSRGNEESNGIMDEFSERLSNLKQPLNYSRIANMKDMRKVFLCEYLNTNIKYDLDAMDDSFSEGENKVTLETPFTIPDQKKKKIRKRLRMGRWQQSLSALHSYKDALAADLLSIWDVEMEDEQALHLSSLKKSLRVKPDPALKVQDWLDTNHNPNPPMISIPQCEASKYAETVNTSHDNSLDPQDISFGLENAIQSTQIADATLNLDTTNMNTTSNIANSFLDVPRSKKKSKKYVKGF